MQKKSAPCGADFFILINEGLFCQHCIDLLYQRSELLTLELACEHYDLAVTIDEHVTRDAGITQGILRKDIGIGIHGNGVGCTYTLNERKDILEFFFTVNTNEDKILVILVWQPDVALYVWHLLAADTAPAGSEL